MRRCCVPGCLSNSGRPYVPTFLFPKDEDRRKLWERNIGKQEIQISKNDGVCIKHFLDIYIIRRSTQGDASLRKTVKLTREAVPSIFPTKLSEDLPAKKRRCRTTSKGVCLKRQKPENVSEEVHNSPTKPSPQKGVLGKDSAMQELLQKPCVTSRPIITIVKAEDITEADVEAYIDSKSDFFNEPEEMNTEEPLEPEPQASPGAISAPKQDDDNVEFIKASTGRSLSVGSSSNTSTSSETSKLVSSPVPKRRKIEKPPPTVIGKQNDVFCWVCHKDPAILPCSVCKRSYHQKCAGVVESIRDWVCLECASMLHAGNMDHRSKTLSDISMEKFCALLKTCLTRLKGRAPTAFHQPVPVEYYRNYLDFVIHPMDLSLIEKKIKQKLYGCTEVFLADVKWILHNSTVFNGAQHPLTVTARKLVRIAEADTAEVEICPDCYLHTSAKSNRYWFSDVCEKPHPIVWAKLKGFPYWPAKIVKIVDDSVDARFFGAHDRAWVPICQCYHLSREMPTSSKPKKKQVYDTALEELSVHVSLLNKKYGTFVYAPYRTPFNPKNKIYAYHGIDIDSILKKAKTCNGTSVQNISFSNGKMLPVQPDTTSKVDILQEGKDSANLDVSTVKVSISSSLKNGDSCPNDSSAGNTDSNMQQVHGVCAENHQESNGVGSNVITIESPKQDSKKTDQGDDIIEDGLEPEKKESSSSVAMENNLKIKDKLTDDNSEILTLKNMEVQSFKSETCDNEPEQAASTILSSFDASKAPNFELKESLFDTTLAPNSIIENFKMLESDLAQLNDLIVDDKVVSEDAGSSSLTIGKKKEQSLLEAIEIHNGSKIDETPGKSCENLDVFENLQHIETALHLPEIPCLDLGSLLPDNKETKEKATIDDLKIKSAPEIENRDVMLIDSGNKITEDVVNAIPASKKMDQFYLNLGKTIESCKAKLGITDLSEDHSSNDSDSGEEEEDDDDDDDDDEDDDDEDGEESENNEEVSDEEMEEGSEISDDEDESELEQVDNKADKVTDIMAKPEMSETSEIEECTEKQKTEIMDIKMSDATKPEEVAQVSQLPIENNLQLERKVESKCESQDDKDGNSKVIRSQDEDVHDDPASKTVDLKSRSPIKDPETVKDDADDSITHNLLPEVAVEEEHPDASDDVIVFPKQNKPEPTVIDVIDLSSSDSEVDEVIEVKSPEKPCPTATTESNRLPHDTESEAVTKLTSESNSKDFKDSDHGNDLDLKNNADDMMEVNGAKAALDFDSVGKDVYSHDDGDDKENHDEECMETEVSPPNDIKVNNENLFTPTIFDDDDESAKVLLSSDVPSYLNKITPSRQSAEKATTGEKEMNEIDDDVEEMDVSDANTSFPTVASVKKQLVFDLKPDEENDNQALIRELQDVKEQLRLMKLKYEKQDIYHHQDKLELKHSTNILITEMRASLETYRKDAMENLEQKFEMEKKKAVEETKGKQWCSLCKIEAIFLCCWNTSYCSFYCQKQHWSKHRLTCTQVKKLPPVSKPATTEYVKIAKKPTVSESVETNHGDKKVYLLKQLKQSDVVTSRALTQPDSVSNALNSLPNPQFVASTNQFQKVVTSTSAASLVLPKPPVQVMFASTSPIKIAQDSAELITKVRSRQTDLNTAIHLLNKMNKETEETLKKKEYEDNIQEEVYVPRMKSEFSFSPHPVDVKTSQENSNKSGTVADDDSDDVLVIDEEDAGGELLRLNHGVEITKKQLLACVKASTNATRLARSLMEVLISFKTLAESSVFGRKSNVNKKTRPALKLEVVKAIIEFVMSVYPSALKTDIVLAMNFKCKEARHALYKLRTENSNEDLKRKAESDVGNVVKIQKTDSSPVVPTMGSLKPPSSPSFTVTSLSSTVPLFPRSATSAIKTVVPRQAIVAPLHSTTPNFAVRSPTNHILACNARLKNSAISNLLPNIVPIKPKPTIVAIETSNKLKQNQIQTTPPSNNEHAKSLLNDVSLALDGLETQSNKTKVKNDSDDGSGQTSDIKQSDVPLINPIDGNHATGILLLGLPVATVSENSSCKQQVTSKSKDESSNALS